MALGDDDIPYLAHQSWAFKWSVSCGQNICASFGHLFSHMKSHVHSNSSALPLPKISALGPGIFDFLRFGSTELQLDGETCLAFVAYLWVHRVEVPQIRVQPDHRVFTMPVPPPFIASNYFDDLCRLPCSIRKVNAPPSHVQCESLGAIVGGTQNINMCQCPICNADLGCMLNVKCFCRQTVDA